MAIMRYTTSIYLWILSLANVLQHGTPLPLIIPSVNQRCFGELGCFSNEAPFNNTDLLPEVFQVEFRSFTGKCQGSQIIPVSNNTYASTCKFDLDLPLKIVIHGFWQDANTRWISDIVTELLKKEPMNIITVDWGSGAFVSAYNQAVANSRVAAAQISHLIRIMKIPPQQIHIIGFSLGAHIAGYVGENIKGIGRITGLDPAGPSFSNTEPVVHLEKTDAEFVDIIHTDGTTHIDGNGLGWIKDTGHIDFYPNGGEKQPGCPGLLRLDMAQACSHARSTQLFIESINTDSPFYGHQCGSISDLDSNLGNCLTCPFGKCPEMGYNADKTNSRGKYYLRTREISPYSGYAWHVEVEFGNMNAVSGQVIVEMTDSKKTSTSIVIGSGREYFRSGDRRDIVSVNRQKVGDVKELTLIFHHTHTWLTFMSSWFSSSDRHVVISKVMVTSAENGRSIHFCGDNVVLQDGHSAIIVRSTTDPNECSVTQPGKRLKSRSVTPTEKMFITRSTVTTEKMFTSRSVLPTEKGFTTQPLTTLSEKYTISSRFPRFLRRKDFYMI